MSRPRDPEGRFIPADITAANATFTEVGLHSANAVLNGELTPESALAEMGLDPDKWEVKRFSVRKTQTATGETRHHTSLGAAPREVPLSSLLPVEEVLAGVANWGKPPVRRPRKLDEMSALCVFLADWQLGGTGPGGGTKDTIARVLAAGDAITQRIEELRERGTAVDRLYVFGLGDLVESCSGFYANQAFTVDMDNRAQMRTAYMLLSALLTKWLATGVKIHVTCVGGNHGQTREGGKSLTGPGDNKDILTFEIVRDQFALGGKKLAAVTWDVPDNEIAMVTDVCGVLVGTTHGDLFGGGANAAAKAERWWRGQTFGLLPVQHASILVSGHFHHFSSVELAENGRTWFQTPAMDNGSEWFTNATGISSAPGTLTMRIGKGCGPRGWDDLQIV